MEQNFFDTMRVHKNDHHDKTENGSRRNERLQLGMVWSVEKCVASTAPASIVVPTIDQDVIPTTHVLQKNTNQSSAPTDDP